LAVGWAADKSRSWCPQRRCTSRPPWRTV
jgi:hypothetical protein